ncbi:MAG TPA: class I adenylate-forming enzyme family protein, partial [Clostridia bacterium]
MGNTSNKNLYAMIKETSGFDYEKAIIDVDNSRLSHREFIQDTKTISSALRNIGVLPGQKVGMIMNNSTLWFKVYWSIVKIGGHPVPLDPQIGEWEMERLLTLADIEICFINNSYRANNILSSIQNARACVPNLKHVISVDNEKSQGEIISFEQFIRIYKRDDDFIYTPNELDTLMLACTSGSTGNPKVIAVPHIGFYQSQKDMAAYL